MEPTQRLHEATARQILADVCAAAGLHDHAGPDRRELALNDLVERALHAYEGFRRFEAGTRSAWAEAASGYDPALRTALENTTRLHLEIGHDLVGQLDAAVLDRLTVRNVLPFRQAYADLLALEVMDHGLVPPAVLKLAETAHADFIAGKTQQIDPDDHRNGVESYRTWDFIKKTAGLAAEIHQLAEKRYRTFFAVDDRHPALGGHPVFGALRATGVPQPALWSVEISHEHRALAVVVEAAAEQPLSYVWFWIGNAVEYCSVSS